MSEIEDIIQARGLTAPRVTEDIINAKIDSEMYIRTPETGLTLCKIQMKNGFCFIGHSACVSPENYDRAIGDKIAYDNAFRQIWSHEGYLMRELMLGHKMIAADQARLAAKENDDHAEGDLQLSLGHRAHE